MTERRLAMPWGTCKTCLYLRRQLAPEGTWLIWARLNGFQEGYYCGLAQRPIGRYRYYDENALKEEISFIGKLSEKIFGDISDERFGRTVEEDFYSVMSKTFEGLGNRGCNKWEMNEELRKELARQRSGGSCLNCCRCIDRVYDSHGRLVQYRCTMDWTYQTNSWGPRNYNLRSDVLKDCSHWEWDEKN